MNLSSAIKVLESTKEATEFKIKLTEARYEYFEIERKEEGWTWTSKYNYKKSNQSGYKFPLKNGMVQYC